MGAAIDTSAIPFFNQMLFKMFQVQPRVNLETKKAEDKNVAIVVRKGEEAKATRVSITCLASVERETLLTKVRAEAEKHGLVVLDSRPQDRESVDSTKYPGCKLWSFRVGRPRHEAVTLDLPTS